jgi:DNA-binding NarL/FixJ family response regulator
MTPERTQFERRVVVVEDEDFLRSLIASYLRDSGFSVKTASSAREAVKVIQDSDPDALVLDIDLGSDISGIDIARRFKVVENGIGVVFLTSISDDRFLDADISKEFPKASYLNKRMLSDPATLVDALDATLQPQGGARYRHDRTATRPLANLTKTQIKVLKLIADGKTNKQIAEIRDTTLEAAEALVSRTMRSLGLDANSDHNLRVLAVRQYLNSFNNSSNLV